MGRSGLAYVVDNCKGFRRGSLHGDVRGAADTRYVCSRHALRARGGFRLIGTIDVSVFLVLTIVTGLRDRLLGSDSRLKLWTI